MGIEHYLPDNDGTDHFEFDARDFVLSFPCCTCAERHKNCDDEPCIDCEHNAK